MAVWIPYWDLRCEKCSDSQKLFNGCEDKPTIEGRWQIREYDFDRCPLKLIDRKTTAYIEAYNYLQKGIMPYASGYKNNSNKYVEAMRVIDNEVNIINAQQAREARRR